MPLSRMGSMIAKQWLAPAPDDAETYPGHEIRLMLAREYLELEAENERLREALVVAPTILAEAIRLAKAGHHDAAQATLDEFERICVAALSDEKQS